MLPTELIFCGCSIFYRLQSCEENANMCAAGHLRAYPVNGNAYGDLWTIWTRRPYQQTKVAILVKYEIPSYSLKGRFFCNPNLFAGCTSKFSKFCKNIYSVM
jgi:hypothetical protein